MFSSEMDISCKAQITKATKTPIQIILSSVFQRESIAHFFPEAAGPFLSMLLCFMCLGVEKGIQAAWHRPAHHLVSLHLLPKDENNPFQFSVLHQSSADWATRAALFAFREESSARSSSYFSLPSCAMASEMNSERESICRTRWCHRSRRDGRWRVPRSWRR